MGGNAGMSDENLFWIRLWQIIVVGVVALAVVLVVNNIITTHELVTHDYCETAMLGMDTAHWTKCSPSAEGQPTHGSH